jgi:hypothetical protein
MSRDAVPPGVRRSWRLAVNPNAEKAAHVLNTFNPLPYILNRNDAVAQDLASRLDSAGLLITPLHERALKACEGLPAIYYFSGAGLRVSIPDEYAVAVGVGRESLAARKAKEPVARYVAREITSNAIHMTSVWDNALKQIAWTGFTEQQARAVAEALNTLEADNGR